MGNCEYCTAIRVAPDVPQRQAHADGQPVFNVFNLNVGDLAPIDAAYWDRANRLCSKCVARVAAWAEA